MKDKETKTCPNCHGTGKKPDVLTWFVIPRTCPTCKGTGKVNK